MLNPFGARAEFGKLSYALSRIEEEKINLVCREEVLDMSLNSQFSEGWVLMHLAGWAIE